MLEILAAMEETGEAGGDHLNPYIIGAVALGALLVLLFVLVAFGKGREHV